MTSLDLRPALDHPDLLAPPVTAALDALSDYGREVDVAPNAEVVECPASDPTAA